MSTYFNFFPKIEYNIYDKDSLQTITATNIFIRQRLKQNIDETAIKFYPYIIQEGERADILAYNYYGEVSYIWLIWFANDIIDPYRQWPFSLVDMNKEIRKKYGSILAAKELPYEYRQIIRQKTESSDLYDIIVDETTYNNLPTNEKRIISAFEYEVDKNNAKRNIKLIDPTYANIIYQEAQLKFGIGVV